jgi:hypothetical protein
VKKEYLVLFRALWVWKRVWALASRSHPFPVPLKTCDESIAVLRRGLDAVKRGDADKTGALKRLENFGVGGWKECVR